MKFIKWMVVLLVFLSLVSVSVLRDDLNFLYSEAIAQQDEPGSENPNLNEKELLALFDSISDIGPDGSYGSLKLISEIQDTVHKLEAYIGFSSMANRLIFQTLALEIKMGRTQEDRPDIAFFAVPVAKLLSSFSSDLGSLQNQKKIAKLMVDAMLFIIDDPADIVINWGENNLPEPRNVVDRQIDARLMGRIQGKMMLATLDALAALGPRLSVLLDDDLQEDVVEALIETVDYDHWVRVQQKAVWALGETGIRSEDVFEILKDVVEDDDYHSVIRREAKEALKKLKSRR